MKASGFRPRRARDIRREASERGCRESAYSVPPALSSGPHTGEPNVRIVIKESDDNGDDNLAIGLIAVAADGAARRRLRQLRRAAITAASTPTTRTALAGSPRAAGRPAQAGQPSCCPAAPTPSKSGIAALQGLPGRGQRLGLLVRALPLRVPDPAEALRRATASGSPSSASTAKTPTPPPKTFLEEAPVPYPELHRPRQRDRRLARRQRAACPTPPSTTATASLCYLKQGPYADARRTRSRRSPLRPARRLRKRIIGSWTHSSSSP